MGSSPGFMIPLNEDDFFFPFDSGTRNICSSANQSTYTHAPWWTCENIQLTGTVDAVTARVGDNVVIQVGVQGLRNADGDSPSQIQNAQAWVCYPNTVAGAGNATLVVPSMQSNHFASFSNTTPNAPIVFGDSDYENPKEGGFQWISLSTWIPTQEDFLEQATEGGHCCVIANVAGQSDVDLEENSGDPVGVNITDNSELNSDINVCTSLYQAQRNIAIVGAKGGMMRLGFLSGAPSQRQGFNTTVSVTAISQGSQIDPILKKVLATGPYKNLPLKPAANPPKSLRLTPHHDYKWNNWLSKIVREAEEIVDELLGLDTHPFGGHQLRLRLPPAGLQPIDLNATLEPGEPAGTVHALDIIQTDANGARGGIRVAVVAL